MATFFEKTSMRAVCFWKQERKKLQKQPAFMSTFFEKSGENAPFPSAHLPRDSLVFTTRILSWSIFCCFFNLPVHSCCFFHVTDDESNVILIYKDWSSCFFLGVQLSNRKGKFLFYKKSELTTCNRASALILTPIWTIVFESCHRKSVQIIAMVILYVILHLRHNNFLNNQLYLKYMIFK